MRQLTTVLLILVSSFSAFSAIAQSPRAVITGPKDARCGSLVVLDASESTGTGRLWLLAVSPEETSFLPVESGLKCIFASPVAGSYRFVLVVAGTNANGGPAAEMATHTVTLSGGLTPQPPPVVTPPDPIEPPEPTTKKVVSAAYVYEKDETNPPKPVLSALQKINADGSGIVAAALDDDVVDDGGDVPEQYAKALEYARKAGLPCLVVTFSDGTLRTVQSPKTEADVMEALK